MKKITVSKEDGVAEVVERVLDEEDADIALVIPKGSALARSVANFHLLKREADSADKAITIESVDDTILAFAKESDLDSNHPLWRGVQGSGGVSDIVPATAEPAERRDAEKRDAAGPPAKRRIKKQPEAIKLTVREEKEGGELSPEIEGELEATEEKEDRFLGSGGFFKGARPEREREEEGGDADGDDDLGTGRRRIPKNYLWAIAAVLALLVVAFGLVTWVFARASVAINFKKTPWELQGVFAADKSVSAINAATNVIPAQVFTANKNATQLFPASGKANVSVKARGTITIYNAYSSAKQDLVATTRFLTPDGKIFRLVSGVTVPGASVTNGHIVPSSIDVPVVADQAGPAYNIGPVDKLTVPGLQRSPKYTGFYGQMKNAATGGSTGVRAVPTAADVVGAKDKATKALQQSLTNGFTTNYPNNFKILDGATTVTVTKLIVTTSTDDSGKFSVFGEATLQAIGFDEQAFRNYLLSLAQSVEQNSAFDQLTLGYDNVRADFARGRATFSLSAQGTLKPVFSPDRFKASIAGKSVNDARSAVAALPELSDGKLSVWPMWLWNIPSNPNKVQITAN